MNRNITCKNFKILKRKEYDRVFKGASEEPIGKGGFGTVFKCIHIDSR